jgi:hypothetical protein
MPDAPAPRPDLDTDLPVRMPQQIPREAQGMPDVAASGRGDGMPSAPRRYVSMEKFIEEAGDELTEVLPNAYKNLELNDDNYPTHLVSFSDARNSMYRSRVPSKEFFDWLHSDRVMDGLVFADKYEPATAGEGATHTRESYQALINRLRDISLRKPKPSAALRGQAMPDVTITPDEARRQGLVGPVYHGSPDFKGRKFDPKYRARSSGLSRGGFSFTEDVASADSYAGAGVDSAQAAVDAANDVMRDLGARMESGLKLREFADVSEVPEFNVRYADDMDELASYFNDLSKRIPKDLGARLRDAAKAINEPANPVVVEAYLRNPKEMMIDGKRLLVAENPDDIFVSAARPPQAAPSAAPRGQAMPDAGENLPTNRVANNTQKGYTNNDAGGQNQADLQLFGRRGAGSENDGSTAEEGMGAKSYRDRLQSAQRRHAREVPAEEFVSEILEQEKILAGPDRIDADEASAIIPPNTGGNEHDVFQSGAHVYKRLKSRLKWGRPNWTPMDYFESIELFNQIAPAVKIDVLGISDDANGLSVVTRMPFVEGKHLSDSATHRKLLSLGFEQYNDGSGTLDYVHRKAGVIIRDAHRKNFVTSPKQGFVPIDLQVEKL